MENKKDYKEMFEDLVKNGFYSNANGTFYGVREDTYDARNTRG